MPSPHALLTLLFAILPSSPSSGQEEYLQQVKPILQKHCVACHGSTRPRGGLRLDTAEAAIRGGRGGPSIVPGKPAESSLLLAVMGEGDSERMPLNRRPLAEAEVSSLRDWIIAGAPSPPDEVPSPAPTAIHWSFLPPTQPELPAIERTERARNPIDRFILKPLEQDGIAPSPEADRETLLRRVSLDLIGLPPKPEEVEEYLSDHRPDSYERLVDRLLESPHYGERWARPWLDLARYADSNGYSIDAPRSIWPYRDWVIDALNRDLPYDRFATEQLAGDLLPDASTVQRVATGFHRNTPINQEGGIDREQFRIDSVIDRTNTTATAFLGLTMGCCQCHDHKYDPITQAEYYRLFAFFNNSDEPEIAVASPEEIARKEASEAEINAYLAELWEREPRLREAQKTWEQGLDMVARQKQSQEVREAFDMPFEKRDPSRNRVVFAAFIDQTPEGKLHRNRIAKMREGVPKFPTTMVIQERSGPPRETHILLQGDFTRPGTVVAPGVPAVLSFQEGAPDLRDRLDLCRWLFSPGHPLTARVAVNRIWQAHFGRGLVETENDFGTQGSQPSHPELLDWLATEFARLGWSQKAMHRLIVTSATYRQSSQNRPDLAMEDPGNRRLARQSRLRLEAELIRDAALTASGLLTPTIGGPSVFPPQPDGVMNLGQMRREWKADTGPDRYRRGLYTYFWRATPHPSLVAFDAPDATRACTRRERSNTPLQALALLNDEASIECARALADRLLADPTSDETSRLIEAYRICLSRVPTATEQDRLLGLLDAIWAEPNTSTREAWTAVARVLLNLDEFLTRE
ncbi:PSD1 and planctomycete cytochrome C domain-containing protein [Tundrisphaera lichenicola]|uniref:PSD1 and planctomycete cytochrome C domain-containing protein n=1 Tax=Tundrisphaera lichenicola TaxID=2029860 RepID=UPI003EBAF1EA